MLQKIRDKISGWFAALFLGAIAVVFIFWGIQFESSVTAAAAKVNGEGISARARASRPGRTARTSCSSRSATNCRQNSCKSEQQKLIDEFISRELLVQRAHELRLSRQRQASSPRRSTQIPALQVDGQVLARPLCRAAAPARPQRSRVRARIPARPRDARSCATPSRSRHSSRRPSCSAASRLEGETREIAYAVIPAAAFPAGAGQRPAGRRHGLLRKTQIASS